MRRLSRLIFLRILSLSTLIVLLNGCLLTDAFKQELIDKNTATEMQKKINELEEVYTLQELSKRIKAVEKVTPEITRIIALENDLSYLVDVMKTDRTSQNQLNHINMSDDSVSSLLPNLDTLVKNSDFNNEEATQNNGIELGAAKPLPARNNNSSANTSVASMNEDKFSNIPDNKVIQSDSKFANTALLNNDAQNVDAKFSNASRSSSSNNISSQIQPGNTDPSAIVGNPNNLKDMSQTDQHNSVMQSNVNNTCVPAANNNGKHSIHLASYRSEENAISGWSKLLQKHNNLLCNLSPKLANVSVKGTDYLSLRVGPLRDKKAALELCSAIKANGDYCASAEYTGKQL